MTEQELLSISMKYPEINFDAVHDASPEAKSTAHTADTSPSSQHDQDTDESRVDCSTAHTTPIKHLMFGDDTSQSNLYAEFVNEVHSSDLPDVTKSYLHSLGSEICKIGIKLSNVYNNGSVDDEEAARSIDIRIAELVKVLQQSSKNCSNQVSTIEWLTELAAFTIVPTDIALWAMYRQRAALITK